MVKRSADTALKSGNISITNGKDFYEWGVKSCSKIKYQFIEREVYEQSKNNIDFLQKRVQPLKGTHAVAGISNNEVMVRETSCVCDKCFSDTGFSWSDVNDCGWRKECLRRDVEKEKVIDNTEMGEEGGQDEETVPEVEKRNPNENNMSLDEHFQRGDFVVAIYDDQVYIGKIVYLDEGQYEVTFMECGSKVKNCLQWPVRQISYG